MTFRARQIRYKRLNQNRTFTLSDERRRCGAHSLSTRDFHCPEEEFGEFYDNPLEDAVVVEELDAGYEEDYCGYDGGEKPAYKLGGFLGKRTDGGDVGGG